MLALEQRIDCKIAREVAACTAPAVATLSLTEDVPTPLATFRSDKIPDDKNVQVELNESSRGPEPLRVTSTAPAGRTGDTAYRQSVVIRRAEQMGEDEGIAHKRARRRSPEYLETGHSD